MGINDIVTIVLAATGCLLYLISSLGIVIMPDLYIRMQAASKASTLGAACMLMAVATHFGDLAVVIRCVLTAMFLLATAPVGAHMIARAGYIAGEPLAPETVLDELRGRYDKDTHALSSMPEKEGQVER